jgi:hypothetical protein
VDGQARVTTFVYDYVKMQFPKRALPNIIDVDLDETVCSFCHKKSFTYGGKLIHVISQHLDCALPYECPTDGAKMRPATLKDHGLERHAFAPGRFFGEGERFVDDLTTLEGVRDDGISCK